MEAEGSGLESSDLEEVADVGYGRKATSRTATFGWSGSGSITQLSDKGKTKLDRQLDAAFPKNDSNPDGADSHAPAKESTVHEVINKVPILKDLSDLFGDEFGYKLEIHVYGNVFKSDGADAKTDVRRHGNDYNIDELKGKPHISFYGASFADGYRGLGHTILHEFGHVFSYLSGNFFNNLLTEQGSWNRAVYKDENFAYWFAYNYGGHHPTYYADYTLAHHKYDKSWKRQIKGKD